MSWQDRVNNSLTITTGDGKSYNFKLWIEAAQEMEWNSTDYDYIDVGGTFIDKRNDRGRRFPLKLFFQGDDHLDQSEAFRVSLKDRRFSTINHPFYGILYVQILELRINNAALNLSELQMVAYETITNNTPVSAIDPIQQLQQLKLDVNQHCEEELGKQPTIQDVNTLKLSNSQNYKSGLKIATLPQDAQNYFNAFSTASNAINVITATPLQAVDAIIAVITLPAQFQASVQSRISVLLGQMDFLRRTLTGIFSPAGKQLFEIQGAQILSSTCLAAIAPLQGNYTNAASVLTIINSIKTYYTQFLADLDTLQGPNGGNPNYFVPGFQLLLSLNQCISLTLTSLLQIALNGKKEISVVLTQDSNMIMLTDKYYGLDDQDVNIQALVDNNGLTVYDTLIIQKGRTILYYV